MKKQLLLGLMLGLLCGCSTTKAPQVETDPAEIKLAEAASSVSHSLNDIAAVEQAANPQAKLTTPNPASYDMQRLVSIDWSGPIEPLLARLAHASGYRFHAIGTAPAVPIVVNISAKHTPMGDVLRNAGFQANNRADVVVYPSRHLIEIHYSQA